MPDVPETPPADDAILTTMSGVNGVLGMGPGGGPGNGGSGRGLPLFGATDGTGLQGYFYDFKQTPDRTPTGMTSVQYNAVPAKYLAQGWDDTLLKPYYRSKDPLFTDHFAISTRPSEDAPKAFALEKEVQPGLWIVVYRGKVSVAEAGDIGSRALATMRWWFVSRAR